MFKQTHNLMSAVAVLMLTLQSTGAFGFSVQVDQPEPVAYGPRMMESTELTRISDARKDFDVHGNGMTVAIIDSGIRQSHVDFGSRIIAQVDFTNENNPSAPDGRGHGSLIAGIIAADGVNTGVAPMANIVVLKVFDDRGWTDWKYVVAALEWVVANRETYGITVVNMSFGQGSNLSVDSPEDPFSKLIRQLRGQNVACVASSGNNYFYYNEQGMSYPASESATISVGAVFDENFGSVSYGTADYPAGRAFSTGPDRICPFSQRLSESVSPCNRTDIFAPGAIVTSTGIFNDTASSSMHGTSASAAVVSGVVLLVQEYCMRTNGRLPSVDEIERILRDSASVINDGDDEDDDVTNTNMDYPRVDAWEALCLIGGSPVKSLPMEVVVRAGINFKKGRTDRLLVRIGISDYGEYGDGTLEMDFGGWTRNVLAARTRMGSSPGKLTVALKFTREDLDRAWSKYGIENIDAKRLVTVPMRIRFMGKTYEADVTMSYSAHRDRRGRLKSTVQRIR